MPESVEKPTCFIAMPITTQPEYVERYNGDQDHWGHVMGSLFERAIEEAGFRPIRPAAQGSHLIHAQIIRHLSTASLVLVDLSTHNPNVFFELGVRTSLDLPITLVRDEHTNIPFDTSGINTYEYDSNLRGWELEEQRDALKRHILESHASCAGKNPLWQQFGLKLKASEPDSDESPREAKLDLIVGQLARLQSQMESDRIATHAATHGGMDDAETAWSKAEASRRREPRDPLIQDISNILRSSNTGGASYVIQRFSPTLIEVGADSLSHGDLTQIHRLENMSGVEITVRPLSEVTIRGQRSSDSASVGERRHREQFGVPSAGH